MQSPDPDPSPRATSQMATGVSGLDRVLRGGLRLGGLHVLVGGPGSGKSVLAHQMGAHVIRAGGGTVLYLTALVESHQTLLSQARTFAFFDPTTVANAFYYAGLYPALQRGALRGVSEEISRLVRERSPSLLIVDGLHAIKLVAGSRLDYQRFIHELEAQSALTSLTSLLLTHPGRAGSQDPTLAVADGILALRTHPVKLRSVRMISVRKLRGVAHLTGWHTFTVTREGVRVFPRLESIVAAEGLPPSVPKPHTVKFEVGGLHEMLGRGPTSASMTLLTGTPGAGKTLLSLAFLSGGVPQKEQGLYVGFHETPDRLLAKADGVGLQVRKGVEAGTIHLHWEPPSEMLGDAIAERVLELVERHRVQRLVLDALDDLRRSALPGDRALEFLSAFLDILRARGVATLLTQDLPRIAGPTFDLPFAEVSPIVDNLLHLRYTEIRATLQRLIVVLKMREESYDTSVREFLIDSRGMRVGEPFREGQSLLTGLPRIEHPDRR